MDITKPGLQGRDIPALVRKSMELESAFLSEMLGHAGVGAQADAFSGGIGEDQFASFLRDAQADALVRKGGIGLAELIFRSLARTDEGHHE